MIARVAEAKAGTSIRQIPAHRYGGQPGRRVVPLKGVGGRRWRRTALGARADRDAGFGSCASPLQVSAGLRGLERTDGAGGRNAAPCRHEQNAAPCTAGEDTIVRSELSTALRTGARVLGSRGVLAGRGFHVKRTGTVRPVCRRGEWRVGSHETRADSMAVRSQQGVRATVSRETSVPARPDCSQGVGRAVELTNTGHGVLGTLQTRTRLHGVGSKP